MGSISGGIHSSNGSVVVPAKFEDAKPFSEEMGGFVSKIDGDSWMCSES
jgi:hypothetical protein